MAIGQGNHTGGATGMSAVKSLLPAKDHGKTRKRKRRAARASAFMMFSKAVREHMDRTFGGAAAITEHFKKYTSSEVCYASHERIE